MNAGVCTTVLDLTVQAAAYTVRTSNFLHHDFGDSPFTLVMHRQLPDKTSTGSDTEIFGFINHA